MLELAVVFVLKARSFHRIGPQMLKTFPLIFDFFSFSTLGFFTCVGSYILFIFNWLQKSNEVRLVNHFVDICGYQL